jgi:hypothetical protein
MTVHPRSLWSSHTVSVCHDHKLRILPSITGD